MLRPPQVTVALNCSLDTPCRRDDALGTVHHQGFGCNCCMSAAVATPVVLLNRVATEQDVTAMQTAISQQNATPCRFRHLSATLPVCLTAPMWLSLMCLACYCMQVAEGRIGL